MKLQDGMVVKRKDNGLKGVAHKMEGKMWKVKYHDGTHTYTTESAFKNHFVIPELEVNFEDSKCDGVEPEQEEAMTYDEYLNQSDDVVTKHLEKEAHKTMEELFGEYEPTNDSKCDGVEAEQEKSMTYDEYLYMSGGVEPDVEVYFESDLIDNQSHYTVNGIQPIQIMKANMTKEEYRGFLEGNILKYPLRYKHKNGLEDLKKAKTYLTWLIEDIEERGL
ncbi:nucleotide kinase [Enterococcus phage vB_Efs19_KEN07]